MFFSVNFNTSYSTNIETSVSSFLSFCLVGCMFWLGLGMDGHMPHAKDLAYCVTFLSIPLTLLYQGAHMMHVTSIMERKDLWAFSDMVCSFCC